MDGLLPPDELGKRRLRSLISQSNTGYKCTPPPAVATSAFRLRVRVHMCMHVHVVVYIRRGLQAVHLAGRLQILHSSQLGLRVSSAAKEGSKR